MGILPETHIGREGGHVVNIPVNHSVNHKVVHELHVFVKCWLKSYRRPLCTQTYRSSVKYWEYIFVWYSLLGPYSIYVERNPILKIFIVD